MTYWSVAQDQLISTLRASANGLQPDDAAARLKQYGLNTIESTAASNRPAAVAEPVQKPARSDPHLCRDRLGSSSASGSTPALCWPSCSAARSSASCRNTPPATPSRNYARRSRSNPACCAAAAADAAVRTSGARRYGAAVRGQPDPGRWHRARSERLLRQPGGAYRRNVPGREEAGDCRRQNASLAQRTNCVFMGTSVGSGTAQVLIVQTGKATVFGQVAERLSLRAAGDRVRTRHPSLRQPAHAGHAGDGGHRAGGQRLPRQAADRFAALCARAGGGSDAGAVARDHQHHAVARRAARWPSAA